MTSASNAGKRNIVDLLVSVPFELTVALNLLTIQKADPFRYVKSNAAVPLAPVVTVAGMPPPSELEGVRLVSRVNVLTGGAVGQDPAVATVVGVRRPSSSASKEPLPFTSSEQ
jgi:hypothetical protein